ncbi:MAG: universal stress protein [Candidatus Krumholzibacteria bacterium]|nr:universal stress protein [Candidatus Krumholzibacteria bacterium]MDH4335862.1 universal stress protein [Candidatus Krumholzibacteria bacterium]MDH5270354.1 universal stress protein [Candidatus Krumholzibacteria bacterium]MDH5628442.1 universal stress protein [Candidatus Krumholzibacteria bacterium]
MMRVRRILVYARGSSPDGPAIARASRLATHSGAELKLLDVFNELPEEFEPLLSSLTINDAREEAERERRGQLSHIAETLHERGVRVGFSVRWGRPAIEIVQEAIRGKHDMLVMEDGRPRGVCALTQSIVRHCPVPVWIVKNAPHAPPPRVLAAIDPIGPIPGSFDGQVLDVAAAAAKALPGELYVVHAWQPLHDEYEWLSSGLRHLSEKKDVIAQTRERHAHAVEIMLRSILPHVEADRIRLIEGPAARAVLEAVEETGADLLVIGTARSATYAPLLLGKTAETILEHVPVSVLAVKPSGFVSPMSH